MTTAILGVCHMGLELRVSELGGSHKPGVGNWEEILEGS